MFAYWHFNRRLPPDLQPEQPRHTPGRREYEYLPFDDAEPTVRLFYDPKLLRELGEDALSGTNIAQTLELFPQPSTPNLKERL